MSQTKQTNNIPSQIDFQKNKNKIKISLKGKKFACEKKKRKEKAAEGDALS